MKKYDVFISHKSEDKEYLTILERKLEEAGYTFWSDSKMMSGLNWTDQINDAIAESKVVIVLLSQNVLNDPNNIEAEITCAIGSRIHDFLPIKLDDTLISDYKGVFNLYLKKNQWISVNSYDIDASFNAIDASLKLLLSDNESEKEELDAKLQDELARLAQIQREEQEKNFEKRVMDGIINSNIIKIQRLMSNGLYIKAREEIDEQLNIFGSWKFYEQKLICVTKNYSIFNKDSEEVLDILKQKAPEDEYNRIVESYNGKKEEELQRKNRAKQLQEAQEKKKNTAIRDELVSKNSENERMLNKMNHQIKKYKILSVVKLLISTILVIILALILFSSNAPFFLICMAPLLLFANVRSIFVRFLLAIAAITAFVFLNGYILNSSNPLYEMIDKNIIPIFESINMFSTDNLIIFFELFFYFYLFSMICIFSYHKRSNIKTGHYVCIKVVRLVIHLILAIASASLYLVYMNTAVSDIFNEKVLMASLLVVPLIFSTSNFELTKSTTDMNTIKFKIHKIENESIEINKKLEEVNKLL